MGTCACSEQYFFYNINYDDEASQPRISGKKLISSTISAGGGCAHSHFYTFLVFDPRGSPHDRTHEHTH